MNVDGKLLEQISGIVMKHRNQATSSWSTIGMLIVDDAAVLYYFFALIVTSRSLHIACLIWTLEKKWFKRRYPGFNHFIEIQIMGGKGAGCCQQTFEYKKFVDNASNVFPLCLKQTFLPTI